jgi:hypothetical protein
MEGHTVDAIALSDALDQEGSDVDAASQDGWFGVGGRHVQLQIWGRCGGGEAQRRIGPG